MSFQLTAGVARKLGLPGYSSVSASCQIQCELDGTVTAPDEALPQRVAAIYRACEAAVMEELARHVPAPTEPLPGLPTPGDEVPRLNGNGRDPARPLSSRQRAYLERMALRIPDLGLDRLGAFVEEAYGKPLAELTRQQASQLIETLSQVEAGEILLENAAPLIA